MEENNEKVETAQTVTGKVDFKQEAGKTKNLFLDLVKNPIETMKKVAGDKTTNFLVITLVILGIWVLIEGLYSYFWGMKTWKTLTLYKKQYLGTTIRTTIAPIVGIAVYSLTVFLMNNKANKKPITTVISTMIVSKFPEIIVSILFFLNFCGDSAYKLVGPINQAAGVLSIILGYFGIKALFGEEDDKSFFKKYAIIIGIYYLAYIILSMCFKLSI